jgi:NAD(P)H-hydrate epimerase
MKVLTATQMREADRLTTERFGVPSLQLMENAGAGVVAFLQGQFADLSSRRIFVLCGKGNNGGDGLVVARLLKRLGCHPSVFLFAAPDAVRGDAAVNLKRWLELSGELRVIAKESDWRAALDALAGADLIVDALLGTGLSGSIEGLLRAVIEDVNRLPRKIPVVAVDIPSGLPSDGGDGGGPVIRADYTVTFTAPKVGQLVSRDSACVGRLLVRQLGTPRELLDDDAQLKLHWMDVGEFRALPLRRRPDAHKGDYGHALLVAGSRGKTGAAVLAGWGAMRVGAGLVTVATPDDVLPIVASALPEIMTAPLASTEAGSISLRNLDYGRFAELMKEKNVLALGPGLSSHQETQQFVRTILADCPLPVVLDADGLNAFAGRADELGARRAGALAMTPHPGEMARLLGCTTQDVQSKRLETALETAARWRAFVVLKGYHTIVATPDGRAFINSTGNPGMATGGTGDVLTGMLAGLTAQFGTEHWERVLGFGVYLHGLAGDLAAARVGEAPLMASDLIAEIPEAFRQAQAELEHDA